MVHCLIRNERAKLTAGLLNTIAGFSITARGLGPLIAISYGVAAATAIGSFPLLLMIVVWLLVGSGLHILARRILGGLAT